MTSIPSVSQAELTKRRQTLRRERRIKLLQSIWQTLAVSGILGGLIWATTRPVWVLHQPNQIMIEGNNLLSKQVIHSVLRLKYPQSLLRVQPEAIAHSLELYPPIADAIITRQLFPPGLRVQIQERIPVALAIIGTSPTAVTKLQPASAQNSTSIGLLDASGVWIPINSYGSQERPVKVPNLKVIGKPQVYRPYWSQLYQAISNSSLKITEINCQDSGNLILKTELGIVHLGTYSPRLNEQLQVLAKMRQLPTKVQPGEIAYIDLKNPATPLVQMHQVKKLVKPDTP